MARRAAVELSLLWARSAFETHKKAKKYQESLSSYFLHSAWLRALLGRYSLCLLID